MKFEVKDVVLGTVATAAAVASGAAAASADDMTWSGFYVGGQAGYSFGGESGAWDRSYDVEGGPALGFQGGFNVQYESGLVLGLEGAFTYGPRGLDYDDDDYDYSVSAIVDLKARVGYAFEGSGLGDVLVFGFAGMSYMPYEWGYEGSHYDNFGVNLGLGAEVMVTDSISVGGEFIYRNTFDAYDFHGYVETTDTSISELMLRVNYNFN